MVTPIQKYNHNACLPSYTGLGESSELKMILNYDERRIGGGEGEDKTAAHLQENNHIAVSLDVHITFNSRGLWHSNK